MNGPPFKLATIARVNTSTKPFAALVLGEEAIDLSAAHTAYRAARGGATLRATDNIRDLLEDWDANFAVLQEMVAFIKKDGVPAGAAVAQAGLRIFAPVLRPGKMFYAAQNFQEHVDEMIRAGMTPAGGPKFTGEKSTTVPYLFLKAPSTLCGAFDDIAIPRGMKKIDWEAEIALAIGKRGKRIKAERALDHVAGFMTTNDVSCRDLQIRQDRPALRSDWLGGKSHDNFAPMGPYLVPRAFVPRPHETRHPPNGQRRGQAERQYLAIHLHPRGADRVRLEHAHPRGGRRVQLRYLRRRRSGYQHVSGLRRYRGDRDRNLG